MSNLLDDEIYTYNARDFEQWLLYGTLCYYETKRLPSNLKIPNAFPSAELYIGRNEAGLSEDLADVYFAIPDQNKVLFQNGVVRAWSAIGFEQQSDFKLAALLLTLATRVHARNIIECLPHSLGLLAIASQHGSFSEAAHKIRKRAFQAILEMGGSTNEEILCVDNFLWDDRFDKPLLEPGIAHEYVAYLAKGDKQALRYWCAIFGNAIVLDIQDGSVTAADVRKRFEEEYSKDQVERVIKMVKQDDSPDLSVGHFPLSSDSLDGLHNLVTRLDASGGGKTGLIQRRATPWARTTENVVYPDAFNQEIKAS